MNRKKLLLVGAGTWGKILLKNFYLHPRARISGIVSSKQSVDHSEADTIFYPDLLSAEPEAYDGVILATPPDVHDQQLLSLIPKNTPVWVEKPVSLSKETAQKCLSESKKYGSLIFVDHIHLYQPFFEFLKREVDPTSIMHIRGEGANWGPFRKNYNALWDYGSHDLSMIFSLFPQEPTKFEYRFLKDPDSPEINAASFQAELEFESGRTAKFISSNISRVKIRKFEVETESSIFCFQEFPEKYFQKVNKQSKIVQKIHLEDFSPLRRAIDVFLDGLDGSPDWRWGLETGVRVCEAISKAKSVKN